MGGPESGKYLIIPAQITPEPPAVGVDFLDGAPVFPVVIDGQEKVWNVTKLEDEDGNYSLVLTGQTPPTWFGQVVDDRVVVNLMPPPSIWTIEDNGEGLYTITVPSRIFPQKAWTVDDPEPKSPVYLRVSEFPQLWKFVPLLED